jgi:hypothetical protein
MKNNFDGVWAARSAARSPEVKTSIELGRGFSAEVIASRAAHNAIVAAQLDLLHYTLFHSLEVGDRARNLLRAAHAILPLSMHGECGPWYVVPWGRYDFVLKPFGHAPWLRHSFLCRIEPELGDWVFTVIP